MAFVPLVTRRMLRPGRARRLDVMLGSSIRRRRVSLRSVVAARVSIERLVPVHVLIPVHVHVSVHIHIPVHIHVPIDIHVPIHGDVPINGHIARRRVVRPMSAIPVTPVVNILSTIHPRAAPNGIVEDHAMRVPIESAPQPQT